MKPCVDIEDWFSVAVQQNIGVGLWLSYLSGAPFSLWNLPWKTILIIYCVNSSSYSNLLQIINATYSLSLFPTPSIHICTFCD